MDTLTLAVLDLFGDRVATARRLHGGDLSEVQMLTLQGGSRMIAKIGPNARVEARMLCALKEAGAPVPDVLGVAPGILFLEPLTETHTEPGSWAMVGQALKSLHSAQPPQALFGWDEDYAFGAVPIKNDQSDNWAEFWRAHRLLAPAQGLPPGLAPRIARLAERLHEILPKTPEFSLLHGDLWSGNIMFGSGARAWFIDPACYVGHSEVDLAMLNLFGSPGPGFEEEYGALDDGWQERRAVYTLWPALVHFQLFGSNYRGMIERLLTQLGV